MYAIVNIAGQQFKVEKGKKVFVHRLPGEVGDTVSFDKVLLISHEERTNVGSPYLPDAVVMAQIISHLRGDKVLVFKKKKRKGYQKLNGHRQYFTQVLIEEISETGVKERKEKKKHEAVKPSVEASPAVVEAPKAEVAAEVTPAVKAPSKKAAAKPKAEAKPKKAAKETTPAKAAKPAARKAPAKTKKNPKK